VIGGVDPADLPDPALARAALENAGFVVSLEVRASEVSRAADVVFPVAPVTDKSGTFVNWEGRVRQFGKVLHNPNSLPDLRVLAGIAEELGAPLGFRTPDQVWAEMTQVGPWDGARASMSGLETVADASTATTGPGSEGEIVLASWKQLVDDGRMQDGAGDMRRTARKPVLLVGQSTLDQLGVAVGDVVTLTGPLGAIQLPIGVADLAEGTVWAPASSPGASVRHVVGPAGSSVMITGGAR
jgi:NADH-quinone oxidoreductase subunit G